MNRMQQSRVCMCIELKITAQKKPLSNYSTCTLAVNLMSCCCRNDRLDEEESQQVEFLVFCTSRNVAKAAGEFLKERLIMAADEEVKKASKSKRGANFVQ